MNKLKDKEQYKELSKKQVIDIIKVYIKEQVELNNRERIKKESYNSPGWPFRQADLTGELRILNKLLDYLP
jgi:hypothetical protein